MAAAPDPLIPAQTPFNYNVGINYESWSVGRTGYNIAADLSQITDNFNLIRTYHDAAVGTPNPNAPQIDGTQQQVINYIKAHHGVELVMGTNNSALAQGGYGQPWAPGLMTSKAYTDAWVDMIIKSFGGVGGAKLGLKSVLLGNEIDANGPPPGDPSFAKYIGWIETSFNNLKGSLAAKGLGSIPVSTTIANYPSDPSANKVAAQVTDYIASHWGKGWNGDHPFVMFNQYTLAVGGDPAKSTDFTPPKTYFETLGTTLGSKLEPFIGETGYSSYYGAANQKSVYQQIFSWLNGEHGAGGKTVPIFLFDAFDRPQALPPFEVGYGIYAQTADSQPAGLKSGLDTVIPGWTDDPINTKSAVAQTLYGTSGGEALTAGAGDDIVVGMAGDDDIDGGSGADVLSAGAGSDRMRGGLGADILFGGDEDDALFGDLGDDAAMGEAGDDELGGGGGDDDLSGGAGDDIVAGHGGDDVLSGGPGNDILTGGDGNDLVAGDAGDDRLHGRGGNDRLFGDAGNDKLNGDAGNDALHGGPGADSLFGGLGDDVLHGDVGLDRLFGGFGADLFAFALGDGVDAIMDFDPAVDRIDMRPTELGLGALSFQSEPDGVVVSYGTLEDAFKIIGIAASELSPDLFLT